jgi:hypothetical protein
MYGVVGSAVVVGIISVFFLSKIQYQEPFMEKNRIS